jgi:hypothetical protein
VPQPRRLLLAAVATCAAAAEPAPAASTPTGAGAAGRRLRLRDAGRRGRLDVPADSAGARWRALGARIRTIAVEFVAEGADAEASCDLARAAGAPSSSRPAGSELALRAAASSRTPASSTGGYEAPNLTDARY